MKKVYAHLVVAAVCAASLSSCGKADYAFKSSASPYHSSTTSSVAVATSTDTPAASLDDATITASTEASPTLVATSTYAVAKAKAAVPVTKTVSSKEKIAAPVAAPTKAERKAVKQMIKQAVKTSPESTQAEGKSQLIALLLAIFVGGLGIHRFYLGYTGIGIAQLLTLGGCGIWALIDLIRIITGDLKPKAGDYAEKL
ncbi:MAG TPA: TM2 domain-containing protein [Hymenobacter sp.]|jgi:hypothetical protein